MRCSMVYPFPGMAIYDMMKNPDVAFEDIMLRHAMTGSSYFPYVDEESEIAEGFITIRRDTGNDRYNRAGNGAAANAQVSHG